MQKGEPRRSTIRAGPQALRPGASPISGDSPVPPCAIWGVLNVTPDSFSDGGRFLEPEAALRLAREMLAEGADVIDAGGESSRPGGSVYGRGASRVPASEERGRIEPVVTPLVKELGARVSIDTVKADVARAALSAGASIVNDVSCGRSDALLGVAAEAGAELVLMHTRGRGEVQPPNTHYGDLVAEVTDELMAAVDKAVAAGVARARIWLDPGIGFAKTAEQSAQLLARTDGLVATGHRVLVGPSRKSFLATLAPEPDGSRPAADERAGGTAAALVTAVLQGAHAVRVHDVGMMRQAVRVAEGIARAREPSVEGRAEEAGP